MFLLSDSIQFNLTDDVQLFVPKSAAILVPTVLNILKQFNYKKFSLNSLKNVSATILSHHRIIESFKFAFAMRSKLGDPDFINIENLMEEVLSESYGKRVWKKIKDSSTMENVEHYGADSVSPEEHGTSHISIIAPDGDAISVTSSINY